MVTYSNGTRIYVNYGTDAVSVDGFDIPAKGYAATAEGKVFAGGTAAGSR